MPHAKTGRKKSPKRILALPDLEHAKTAVLNSLTSASGQRTYEHAIGAPVSRGAPSINAPHPSIHLTPIPPTHSLPPLLHSPLLILNSPLRLSHFRHPYNPPPPPLLPPTFSTSPSLPPSLYPPSPTPCSPLPLCHLAGGELIRFSSPGHVSIQTTERCLGCKQNCMCRQRSARDHPLLPSHKTPPTFSYPPHYHHTISPPPTNHTQLIPRRANYLSYRRQDSCSPCPLMGLTLSHHNQPPNHPTHS